jgi:triosephosphate isomerase
MRRTRTNIVAGNWKMHGSLEMLTDFVSVLAQVLSTQRTDVTEPATVVLFPPVGYLEALHSALRARDLQDQIILGAQDLHPENQGAFTGDMSGAMIRDLGARWVLVGHSERRQDHAEDDQLVARKAAAALAVEVTPVICVGETAEQRDAGNAESVVETQLQIVAQALGPEGLQRCVIAYEPVWAIGTGRTATAATAQAMHAGIRTQLVGLTGSEAADRIPLLYGGSVKAANAAELFAEQDIGGGLVGGASLDPEEFAAIIAAGDSAENADVTTR